MELYSFFELLWYSIHSLREDNVLCEDAYDRHKRIYYFPFIFTLRGAVAEELQNAVESQQFEIILKPRDKKTIKSRKKHLLSELNLEMQKSERGK